MPLADTTVGARGTGLGDETIQLAEETMRVGKRDVAHGRVRLRSYVVEKPVHESVTLHSETVDVSRRPVSRALGAGENLFQEQTISAEGHHEEAVVSKEAHVYEEVGLNRTAADRTEEINDTLRRTEVEVDDAAVRAEGSVGRPLASTGTLQPIPTCTRGSPSIWTFFPRTARRSERSTTWTARIGSS